jgi:hypothetical protein
MLLSDGTIAISGGSIPEETHEHPGSIYSHLSIAGAW